MNIARMEKFESIWANRHDLPAESLVQYRFESREGYRLPELAAHYRTFIETWDLATAEASEPCDGCFMAESESLRKDRTDWQAECLKRGFEYVRESDDHYVLADLPEMADLLGSLLGVEVRTKDNDAYEEANSRLNDQIEGLINTIHAQESMRKDSERWRFVRNPIANGSPYAVWSEGKNVFLGQFADEAIDAAMSVVK